MRKGVKVVKKRVMFYCQHVLGMGHLIRSMEIVRGLKDFEVCFLNGGEIIEGFEVPVSVKVVNLPPIKSDAEFKSIQGSNGPENFEALKSERTAQLLSAFDQFNPDVVIIELFPFGRKNFAFELVPLLARIRLSENPVKVVCSLRDILVSKSNPTKHEARVCDLINRYFDLLLIHADPQFQKLEETFSRINDLKPKIRYTGYVAQSSPIDSSNEKETESVSSAPTEPLILGSIGGGRVGHELLECLISASAILEKTMPHEIHIFTGPYIPDEQFEKLQEMVRDRPCISLERYTSQFLSYMEKADLSVSMAGYNTCMNILTTGTRALVFPFTGNQNNEQTIRAEKLEAMEVLDMIRPDELQPHLLAEKITHILRKVPTPSPLDIQGVKNTVIALKEILDGGDKAQLPITTGPNSNKENVFSLFESKLRPRIEQLQSEGLEVNIFLRDDDIDEDEETLRSLFDISLSSGVPLNLEIMPGKLTDAGIKLLKDQKRFHPALVEFNQHGWQHINHEKEGRKCEFGVSRSFEQQFEDIARGKAHLEEVFDERFFPAFTPPWNRCTDDTFKALSQLGFKVFSKDKGKHPISGYSFQEISTSIDLYRWKGNPGMKSPEEISEALFTQMGVIDPIGLLLHHKVMGDAEFSVLDQLLNVLRRHSNIKFHTFQSLVELSMKKEKV